MKRFNKKRIRVDDDVDEGRRYIDLIMSVLGPEVGPTFIRAFIETAPLIEGKVSEIGTLN